jgi:hypothetical protein
VNSGCLLKLIKIQLTRAVVVFTRYHSSKDPYKNVNWVIVENRLSETAVIIINNSWLTSFCVRELASKNNTQHSLYSPILPASNGCPEIAVRRFFAPDSTFSSVNYTFHQIIVILGYSVCTELDQTRKLMNHTKLFSKTGDQKRVTLVHNVCCV